MYNGQIFYLCLYCVWHSHVGWSWQTGLLQWCVRNLHWKWQRWTPSACNNRIWGYCDSLWQTFQSTVPHLHVHMHCPLFLSISLAVCKWHCCPCPYTVDERKAVQSVMDANKVNCLAYFGNELLKYICFLCRPFLSVSVRVCCRVIVTHFSLCMRWLLLRLNSLPPLSLNWEV